MRVCICYSSRSSRRLALPITKERATLTPTPNMYILTIWAYILKNISMTVISTYPYGHLLLLLSCWCLKFARLRRTKDKASSKRLFHLCIPHPSSRRAQYPAWKTLQRYKIIATCSKIHTEYFWESTKMEEKRNAIST